MKTMSAADAQAVIDAVPEVMNWVITGVKKATIYVSPTLTVKASRRHKRDRRDRLESFVVTIGAPNYAEREFIKLCKKAKEPFPLDRPQLKFYPGDKVV